MKAIEIKVAIQEWMEQNPHREDTASGYTLEAPLGNREVASLARFLEGALSSTVTEKT